MIYSAYHKGFTLVELVVTFAILMVITVGVVVQFRRLSSEQVLENGSDTVRSTFVDLRTAAVTAQQCCGDITPLAYGISITLDGTPDRQIDYFADLDGDNLYTSADTLLSTTSLQDDIDFVYCEMSAVTTSSGTCTVTLTTDSSHTMYYNGVVAVDTIDFTLAELTDSTKTTLNIYPAVSVIE